MTITITIFQLAAAFLFGAATALAALYVADYVIRRRHNLRSEADVSRALANRGGAQ